MCLQQGGNCSTKVQQAALFAPPRTVRAWQNCSQARHRTQSLGHSVRHMFVFSCTAEHK